MSIEPLLEPCAAMPSDRDSSERLSSPLKTQMNEPED